MRSFLFLLIIPFSLLAKPLEIDLVAKSAILMNAETGAILYEKNSRSVSYPASVTKTATAVYFLESQKLPLEKVVKVTDSALKMKSSNGSGDPHWLIPDGSTMGLKKGEEITVESLLHGLMLVSGNDAANVLAEAHSGSIPQFVEELNRYLTQNIGCAQTQFSNPHGIHCDDHVTTAYDLCLIARRGLQIPKFREIVSKASYELPKTNKRPAMELRQTNALLRKGKHYYPKAIGIKTGYLSTAMNTLVAAAEHEGRTLIAVLLGCPASSDRFKDAKALFEKAFQEPLETKTLMGVERLFKREIIGAKTELEASLSQELALSFYPSEEPDCKAFVQWEIPQLPIKKGQKVGEVLVFDQEGKKVLSGYLVAKAEVKGTFFFTLKETFRNWFDRN